MVDRSHVKVEGFFYFAGSLLLMVGMLYWAQAVFIPLAIAVLLTFILTPLVSQLQRWGLPRLPAIMIVAVLVLILLGSIVNVFFLQVKSLAVELPDYKTQIDGKINGLRDATTGSWVANFLDFLNEVTKTASAVAGVQTEKMQPIAVKMEPSLFPAVQSIAGTVFSYMIHIVLVFILVFFMLYRREDLRNRLIRLWGHDHLHSATKALDDASQRISRFLFFQFFLNIGFGLVLAIGLFFIGIPYAFVWGFLTAVLRYIPYLGAWCAAFFPLLFSLVIPGWTSFFLVLSYFILLEIIHSNVIEPLVFGHSIGVSSVALLVAAMFWTWLWGPLGLVLSTPLTACLYVFAHYVPAFNNFTLLLGDEPVMDKSVRFYQRLLAKDAEEAEDLVEDYLKDHAVANVYDDVFLPALMLIKKDRRNDSLAEEEQAVILRTMWDICYDVVVPKDWKFGAQASTGAAPSARVKVIGLAVRDDIDALVLEMFKEVLDPQKFDYLATSPKIFQPESASEFDKDQPSLILLVTLSNANLVRTRIFCKRLRAKFAQSKIVVCCCGLEQDAVIVRDKLKAEGADAVGTTFLETCELLSSTPPVDFSCHKSEERAKELSLATNGKR